jgi:hypothetical protein
MSVGYEWLILRIHRNYSIHFQVFSSIIEHHTT